MDNVYKTFNQKSGGDPVLPVATVLVVVVLFHCIHMLQNTSFFIHKLFIGTYTSSSTVFKKKVANASSVMHNHHLPNFLHLQKQIVSSLCRILICKQIQNKFSRLSYMHHWSSFTWKFTTAIIANKFDANLLVISCPWNYRPLARTTSQQSS